MRDETGTWLAPMMDALAKGTTPGDDPVLKALRAGCVPSGAWVPEPPDGSHSGLLMNGPDGVAMATIDWLKVGTALRELLGWDDYPERPDWPADEVAAHEARRRAIEAIDDEWRRRAIEDDETSAP